MKDVNIQPDLSKEAKQYIFLGVLAAGGLIYVLYQFVFMALLTDLDKTKAEITKVRKTYEATAKMVAQEKSITGQTDYLLSMIELFENKYFPANENTQIWLGEFIYGITDNLGIEKTQVKYTFYPNSNFFSLSSKSYLNDFDIRITIRCSYLDVQKILPAFENNISVANVTNCMLSPEADSPDKVRLAFTYSLPRLSGVGASLRDKLKIAKVKREKIK